MTNASNRGHSNKFPTAGRRGHRRMSTMEAVEPRWLATATVTSTTETFFSDTSGAYFGSVLFGENGFVDGMQTGAAGVQGTTTVRTYSVWDSNPDDGIDSGFVPFELSVNADTAGVTFAVSDSGTSTIATGTPSAIHSVTIQADVSDAYLKMTWQNLTVSFYRGGQLVETVYVGELSAGTLDGTTYGPAEAIATVNANTSSYDGVRVIGEVRMSAAEGMYPIACDIFGKVTIA